MTSKTISLASDFGNRFNPTDEELINYILMYILLGEDALVSRIPLLDFYQFDPWDLSWKNSNELEGYFISLLHAQYPHTNNGRINRKTSAGSWLKKGKDYNITSPDNGEVIGIRKIFVYFCEKDGFKYVMHEYSLPNQSAPVVCKVIKKKPSKKSKGSSKKSGRSSKKVKKTEEKAEMPHNKDNSTPVTDEDFNTSDKNVFSTYNNIISNKDRQTEKSTSDKGGTSNIISNKDQQTEKSTCDKGGTSLLNTSASVYHAADFRIPENQVDNEILPHLQSFPGYDQKDYSLDDLTLDDQPEQVHTNIGPAGTSVSVPEEDLFKGLEPLDPFIPLGLTSQWKEFLTNAL